ncbi:CO/xanthine dehydrogenase Mo-binding subunit [Saccharopolyspora phatthalungensis]|uniref:CO/xanthine dehydrogenase Mo-binding subunit n=2 Tax=Saccharopolyspora phatthalungensis TaxID=664693 RepID=A0A840QJR7_9PSEU|nr:CO/xanthine dehydrogenase Mo-binding subunit [Saccharopolyspora phatthalungensis]
MVGVFGCGRIINPRTARAQLVGGMIWGASHALLEASPIDGAGRFAGADLGAYHFAANADVSDVRVETVEEHDEVINELGAKGVGEIGVLGTAAAVANAVYHATGVRVRETPILLDTLVPDS